MGWDTLTPDYLLPYVWDMLEPFEGMIAIFVIAAVAFVVLAGLRKALFS